MSETSTKSLDERIADEHHCMFCDGPADHKCGKDHDACGYCCGMMGQLAESDEKGYRWIYDVVVPAHDKRVRALKGKP